MPLASADAPSPADLAACRALLRGGSRSFFAAARLLPAAVRDPAAAVYAFCRLADDAIDRGVARRAALARLEERLERAYAGRPFPIPADRAFAEAVARHGIPRALPAALLEGLRWDVEARRPADLEALHAYAARVAGSVGTMVALLMGVRDPQVLARACDLGVAMQLTNIARDVGEDARAGRLYLPAAWLAEAGIDPDAFLAAPRFTDALGAVVARLLAEAERLYARAEAGIARLPAGCRPGIGAARLIYAEIGREVARNGWDSVGARAVVPAWRKLALLAASAARCTAWPDAALAAPPLAATAFLVAAASAAPPPPCAPRGLEARVAWLVALYDRLERDGRAARPARALR
ncbi:phytoene/squalene synthase family protein [Elioraea sp.]|jgi:phytoene synthase|uniref:phytoene/squalene synthase family protein n=1 Tax=Elioraea sp. TaxID=2185103 RepID=UPI0021DE99AA|nr:phytoene/squalene synthase family protein [Elioraea sp.]GIX09025.1 MAG: phytoene synthase [Elioraea sp.]